MKRLSECDWSFGGDSYAYCAKCKRAWLDDLPNAGNLSCPNKECKGFPLQRKLNHKELLKWAEHILELGRKVQKWQENDAGTSKNE